MTEASASVCLLRAKALRCRLAWPSVAQGTRRCRSGGSGVEQEVAQGWRLCSVAVAKGYLIVGTTIAQKLCSLSRRASRQCVQYIQTPALAHDDVVLQSFLFFVGLTVRCVGFPNFLSLQTTQHFQSQSSSIYSSVYYIHFDSVH